MAINVWTGHGIWEGWTMRKYYESCKFGESVLVDPEGIAYSPSDILAYRKIVTSLEKNIDQEYTRIRKYKNMRDA